MNLIKSGRLRPLAAVLSVSLLAACDNNGGKVRAAWCRHLPTPTYSADIVWTEYGIPHVTADDWGSLGYGSGYVAAQAELLRRDEAIVDGNGDSARYFGDDGDSETIRPFRRLMTAI